MAAVEESPVLVAMTDSAEATQAIAAHLAGLLAEGDVVCLFGELGAGKTTFTRGLAAALGAPVSQVSSPTFTLLHEYRGGRLPIFHGDAYRLVGGLVDADTAGFSEAILRREGVFVLEWPERVAESLPAERLDVHLLDDGDDMRRLHFFPRGPRWSDFADRWGECGEC